MNTTIAVLGIILAALIIATTAAIYGTRWAIERLETILRDALGTPVNHRDLDLEYRNLIATDGNQDNR